MIMLILTTLSAATDGGHSVPQNVAIRLLKNLNTLIMHKVSISYFNNSHTDWLRALDFYKHELGVLKNRLTEVAGKNTAPEVMKEVEHFENQFKVQVDNIDRLKHNINSNLSATGKELQANKAPYIDPSLLSEHNKLDAMFHMEEKIVNGLRQQFNRFAAEWM
jgi:hypothetical protein